MPELPPDTIQKAYVVRGGLPRLVLPDLAWLGGCSNSAGWPGRELAQPVIHEPCVAYLLLGERTLLFDTGHYGLWYSMDGQLDAMLQGRALDYVFLSHQEIPHTGNLGRLLAKYPQCKAVGDVRDYHLFHPEVSADRLVMMRHGDRLDLGDREVVFLDAIWKDLSGTMWAYDTKRKLLFSADLFGYLHLADDNICGTMPHEMDAALLAKSLERPALPFLGLQLRDQAARVAAFRKLMARYPIEIVVSGHTAPLMGPVLETAIEQLLHRIQHSPPRFLQSRANGDRWDGDSPIAG